MVISLGEPNKKKFRQKHDAADDTSVVQLLVKAAESSTVYLAEHTTVLDAFRNTYTLFESCYLYSVTWPRGTCRWYAPGFIISRQDCKNFDVWPGWEIPTTFTDGCPRLR